MWLQRHRANMLRSKIRYNVRKQGLESTKRKTGLQNVRQNRHVLYQYTGAMYEKALQRPVIAVKLIVQIK